MQQQLGLEVSKHNPPSLIVLNRLGHLVQFYGGIMLAGSMLRLTKQSVKNLNMNPKVSPDIHIMNLMETYGKDFVSNLYTSAYSLDKKKKTA